MSDGHRFHAGPVDAHYRAEPDAMPCTQCGEVICRAAIPARWPGGRGMTEYGCMLTRGHEPPHDNASLRPGMRYD